MKIETAKLKIETKYYFIKLLEFNGTNEISLFFDVDFGEFEAMFCRVIQGRNHHAKRSKKNKIKSFDHAFVRVKEHQPHLTLLEYFGSEKDAKFTDNEFGEFVGNFKGTVRGCKQHPDRVLRNIRKAARNPERQIKTKRTLKEKYNVEATLQYKPFYDKFTNTMQSEYGVNHALQHPKFMEKFENTMVEKFGTTVPLQNPIIFKKMENTTFERTGYKCQFQSPEIKEKLRLTNKENCGYENHTQSPNYKKLIIDSGRAYNVGGLTIPDYMKKNNIQCGITTFRNNFKLFGMSFVLNYKQQNSSIEQIIYNILITLNINFRIRKRLSGNGFYYHPDFILEDYKLVIECDGLYWHSEAIINNNNYHKQKQENYKILGYDSLFFRSNELIEKPKVVESIIKDKLNLNNKISANDCEITVGNCREFFSTNHLIEGSGEITYYLTNNNEIVFAISGNITENCFEINRFCNKINYTVQGGFDKILKYVISENKYHNIFINFDLRFENMNIIDFNFKETSNEINFLWTEGSYVITNPEENPKNRKLHKIWDCGQLKVELILN